MLRRAIPSTGEELPVIGLGTWQGFDIGTDATDRASRQSVLQTLFDAGGTVVDSSPMYGRAEGVTGDLLAKMSARENTFIATKVWTSGREAGIAEMERSFALFKTDVIDLMQVHNLVDLKTQLKTMRAWKDEGRLRYLGITHYTESAIASVIDALQQNPVDFLQMVYSPAEPEAANRLLPFCQDNGIAFIVNKPLGGRGVISRLQNKPLPGWAAELGISSWAQYFLKFIIAHPAVTCAIPGTGNSRNMADNLVAGLTPLPDEKQQAEMLRYLRDLQRD